MNTKIFASLAIVLTGLVGSPISAEASHNHHNDEVAAAFGGFVGGLIVGTAISHNMPPPPPHVGVVVSGGNAHRHGHWEWVSVRDWVPGRWVYSDRGCGRTTRVWVAGHYECRRDRIWVSHRGHHGCDRH